MLQLCQLGGIDLLHCVVGGLDQYLEFWGVVLGVVFWKKTKLPALMLWLLSL